MQFFKSEAPSESANHERVGITNQLIFDFKADLSSIPIPERLNNPFGTKIPKVARIAAEEFQEFIAKENIYAPRKLNTENLIHTLHQKEITHVYLHFDFDCLEPGEYDKTYYQVPDGLSIQESENCVKALQKNFEVVGSSVLESIAKHQDGLAPITGIIEAFMK